MRKGPGAVTTRGRQSVRASEQKVDPLKISIEGKSVGKKQSLSDLGKTDLSNSVRPVGPSAPTPRVTKASLNKSSAITPRVTTDLNRPRTTSNDPDPIKLVIPQLIEVQQKLKNAVGSIIQKFPPSETSSAPFREIVEEKLGKAPNNGTNARVTINSNITTQMGRFDTKLEGKVVPYINHRANSISDQKKREVSQRKVRLENLQKKIQEQRGKGSTKMTFEQYIDSQIDKQNVAIGLFYGLNEQEKKAKILELKASNFQLQEDLQTLLAEKESSINAQLAIDDNFNLKTEFFDELTKYITPVVTSSAFLGESKTDQVKQHTQLIETALGTKITLEINQESSPRYKVTLNTKCQLGTELDTIEQTIQKELKLPIDLEVAEQTKGLASTETEIERIQRYLAFDTLSFSNEINQKLPQIKISVTEKLQQQLKKILELENKIKAEAQQNIEEESKAKAQEQQVELVSNQEGLSLEFPAEINEKLAIEKQPPPSKSWGSYNIGDEVESLPTYNQGEIPEIIDAQIKLEKLVTELQKKVAELSQQLSEKDHELESLRLSNIGSLSLKIIDLEQKLSKSESERENLFGSNNNNLSRLSSANEELDQLKLKLKEYEASDVLALKAEKSQKEAEIAKMRVSIQEVNFEKAQLVSQDAKSRGEISILQQSLGEAQQQNLLLRGRLLEAQLAQTQDAQPLEREDSVLSMLDTQRADTSDDYDSDGWYSDDSAIRNIREALRLQRIERLRIIKELKSENKELLQSLTSVGDELKNFEQLITTIDQKALSLQQELVAINAENQQLKSNLAEVTAKVEALEAQLAESKAGAEAQAKIAQEEKAEVEAELAKVQAEAKIAQEEKAEVEAQAQEFRASAEEKAQALEVELEKARADAEAQAQEFRTSAEANAKALEVELEKAIATGVQEVQERAEAEALKAEAELAKVQAEAEAELQRAKAEAEDKAKIAQEAQERAEAEAQKAEAELAKVQAEAEAELAKVQAEAKIAQEEKARAEAQAQEAEAKIKELEARAETAEEAQIRAEDQARKIKADDEATITELKEAVQKAKENETKVAEAQARANLAEAQALEFKANAQALEVELGGVIEEAKAIATGVQEDQARAKAEAEAKIAEAQAKIAQEAQERAKAGAEAQAQEAQERAKLAESKLAEAEAKVAEAQAKTSQEAQARAKAEAQAKTSQEDQARAKAEAEAKVAEAQANIVQEAQARATAEAELQRMKLELEQTKAELAKEKDRNIESESAKPLPSRSSTIGPAGWPPPPRTSFSRRRPSVKLTKEMLGDDQGVKGLIVDGRRARLFAPSEQRGRRLLGGRRRLRFPSFISKPETLSSTTSVLPTASGADATKSSTVSSKSLPVLSIPARPEITASLLPSMPPHFEKPLPVSNHEPLRSSLDLEPKKPSPTMTPSSITIFYIAHKRLEQQQNMVKDFLSKIAGGVVSDVYMKDERIYSQQDILDFFQTKGIEFKSYDQALSIIKGVFAKNDEMKNQFAGRDVDISVSHIFKDVFLKQAKEALSPKNKITVSR